MYTMPATEQLRQPIVLTPEEVKDVAGGLNPQPLPLREDVDS
jgi:hypothetical protein